MRDAKVQVPPSELPLALQLDGDPVILRDRFHLMLHKPVGTITALKDGLHVTAYSLLRDAPLHRDLRAVGRLDVDTSGLLLWTTDGTLLHRLTHPRYGVPRTYQAALSGTPGELPADLELDDGHRPQILGLDPLDPADAHPGLARPDGTEALRTISIVGGKFHEVRRIFAALGTEVLGLCRTAYGDLELPPDLPAGEYREVDAAALVRGRHPAPLDAP
jgi:16S rRNA pseudouridine516 synthase